MNTFLTDDYRNPQISTRLPSIKAYFPLPQTDPLLLIASLTNQMWIFQLLYHLYIIQLDIEELVDRLEGAADGDVVFEFNGDFVVDQCFEEAGITVSICH